MQSLFGMMKSKSETLEETMEKRSKIVTEYFNGERGKKIFRLVAEKAEKGDKNACPIDFCPIWFAKNHDKDYPNFFVNPCWEMSDSCLCPLRKDGCDKCPRKMGNNPLC